MQSKLRGLMAIAFAALFVCFTVTAAEADKIRIFAGSSP
jgi:hypothetical protein